MEDHTFRTAAFGGFNRQDVLDYLEKQAKETAGRQQTLQEKLDALEETRKRQDGELAELREKAKELERENEELRLQVRQTGDDLAASRASGERKGSELETARRDLDELRGKVSRLEPDAAAYSELKDLTAGVELSAHWRAQAIQAEAQAQAEELRTGMCHWLQRVRREYDAMRSQVESAVSDASGQLEQAGKCLEQVTGMLDSQDAALESLGRVCRPAEPDPKE